MRWFITIAVLSAVGLAAAFAAVGRAEEKPLTEEPAGEKKVEAPSPEARIDALVARLGSEDYDVRESAYRELERLGEAARTALTRAAKSEDVQTRVSAERLLHKLDAGSVSRRAPGPDRSRERWLEDLERRLREHGYPGDPGAWRRVMEERLRAMRERLEDMERELERDLRSAPSAGTSRSERHVVVRTDEESIDCRVDADGRVRVEISGPADGKTETQVCEAETVEAFREAHPEVWEKVRGFLGDEDGRLRIEIGPRSWPWGPARPADPLGPLRRTRPDDGPRLGILVGEISPALRSHLGLAPEEGMLVEEVLPGTRAERLGLRRYDVLLSVGGVGVGDPQDVRDALAKLAEDDPARVTVVRRGKRTDLVERR